MIHQKLHKKLLTSEVILIIASVFIFRSAWHLLDKLSFFNDTTVLFITLFLGFIIAIPAWRNIIKNHH